MTPAPRSDAVRRVILVERYFPAVTPPRLARLVADTRAAVDARVARSVEITYLTSTAVPEDETCFRLFAPESLEAVQQVDLHLAVQSLRTVRALWTGPIHDAGQARELPH